MVRQKSAKLLSLVQFQYVPPKQKTAVKIGEYNFYNYSLRKYFNKQIEDHINYNKLIKINQERSKLWKKYVNLLLMIEYIQFMM